MRPTPSASRSLSETLADVIPAVELDGVSSHGGTMTATAFGPSDASATPAPLSQLRTALRRLPRCREPAR